MQVKKLSTNLEDKRKTLRISEQRTEISLRWKASHMIAVLSMTCLFSLEALLSKGSSLFNASLMSYLLNSKSLDKRHRIP